MQEFDVEREEKSKKVKKLEDEVEALKQDNVEKEQRNEVLQRQQEDLRSITDYRLLDMANMLDRAFQETAKLKKEKIAIEKLHSLLENEVSDLGQKVENLAAEKTALSQNNVNLEDCTPLIDQVSLAAHKEKQSTTKIQLFTKIIFSTHGTLTTKFKKSPFWSYDVKVTPKNARNVL